MLIVKRSHGGGAGGSGGCEGGGGDDGGEGGGEGGGGDGGGGEGGGGEGSRNAIDAKRRCAFSQCPAHPTISSSIIRLRPSDNAACGAGCGHGPALDGAAALSGAGAGHGSGSGICGCAASRVHASVDHAVGSDPVGTHRPVDARADRRNSVSPVGRFYQCQPG